MTAKTIGLIVGLAFFFLMLVLPVPNGLTPLAMRAGAITLLMAGWWMTEAIPISATALIPLALFPLLNVIDAKTVATNYGHNYVLMLIAGFFIAKAVLKHAYSSSSFSPHLAGSFARVSPSTRPSSQGGPPYSALKTWFTIQQSQSLPPFSCSSFPQVKPANDYSTGNLPGIW